jgi:hypothetical protein
MDTALKHAFLGSYRNSDDEEAGLAAAMRAGRNDRISPQQGLWVTMALAIRWQKDGLARHYFLSELAERAEDHAAAGPADFVAALLSTTPAELSASARKFAQDDPGHRREHVGSFAELISDAASLAPPGVLGVAPDAAPYDSCLGDDHDLAVALARLHEMARARLREYPLAGRVRVLLCMPSEPGLVATLALRHADGDVRSLLHFPEKEGQKDDPRCDAAFRNAFSQALATDKPGIQAAVLDVGERVKGIDGPSLGLAAFLTARNFKAGGPSLLGIAATGGAPDQAEEQFSSVQEMKAKLDALEIFNRLRGEQVGTLLLPEAQGRVSPPPGTELVPIKSARDLEEKVLRVERLVTKLVGALRAALKAKEPDEGKRPLLRRPDVEKTIQDKLGQARGKSPVFLVGDSGTGKSTLAGEVAWRWSVEHPPSRRAVVMTDLGRFANLDLAVCDLATHLEIETRTEAEDLLKAIDARASTLERLGFPLVWILDAMNEMNSRAVYNRAQLAGLARKLRSMSLLVTTQPGAWLTAEMRRELDSYLVPLPVFSDEEVQALAKEGSGFRIPDGAFEVLHFPWAWKHIRKAVEQDASRRWTTVLVINELLRARLDAIEASSPEGKTCIVKAAKWLADRTTFSFPAVEFSAATVDLEDEEEYKVLARDPSRDGFVRFREDWFVEHQVASILFEENAWRTLQAASMEKWLGSAPTPRDARQAETAAELAILRACAESDWNSLLGSLLATAGPELARITARAALRLPTWAPAVLASDIWAFLACAKARDVTCRAAIVEGATEQMALPSLTDDCAKFLAHMLAQPDGEVRAAAQAALQDRVAAGGSSQTAPSATPLSPLVILSGSPGDRSWIRRVLIVTEIPRAYRQLRAIGEGAWVALAEAARVSRVDSTSNYFEVTAGRIAEILRGLRKSRTLLSLLFGRHIRGALFWAFGRVIANWFVRFTPRHNPFRLRHEFKRFFALTPHEKQPMAEIARQIARPTFSPVEDAARILDLTRLIHEQPGIAYPPLISALETAWGTLPDLDASALSRLCGNLEQLFREDVAEKPRHAYAQSCIFILFHLIRRYQRRARHLGVDQEAILVEVLQSTCYPQFECSVRKWLQESHGGLYVSPGGSRMRIMHLFRVGLLAQQMGRQTTLLGEAARLLPVVDERNEHRLETLLDEIFHLGHEFDAWELTGRWLKDWLDLVEVAEGDKKESLRRSLAGEMRKLERRRPAVAQRLVLQLDSFGVRLEIDADAAAGKSLPPVLGISTAAEDLWYQALAESNDFRKWWADWINAGSRVSSYPAWMRSGLHIAFDAVLGQAKRM